MHTSDSKCFDHKRDHISKSHDVGFPASDIRKIAKLCHFMRHSVQDRGSIEDNSKIMFLISQQNILYYPSLEPSH